MTGQEHSKKNVLITGASGLIGSALAPFLSGHGYSVHLLQRTPSKTAPIGISNNKRYTLMAHLSLILLFI